MHDYLIHQIPKKIIFHITFFSKNYIKITLLDYYAFNFVSIAPNYPYNDS